MPIGVGLIGYGYWGPNMLRNIVNTDGLVARVVADPRDDRLALVKRTYPGIRCTSHWRDVIDDPEVHAVVVATPVVTHYEIARAALLADKHVLVGKPMTSKASQAEELCTLAKTRGRVLMVDHTFLYTGAVRKIRELIDAGEIGDILYFDSVRVNLGLIRPDINVLWDLAPHDLSILLYLLRVGPEAVSAVGACHVSPGSRQLETVGYLTLRLPGGVIAHVHVNWLSPVKVRRTLIAGTRRMIVYDDLEPDEKVKVYDKGVHVQQGTAAYDLLVQYRTGDVHIPKLSSQEALAVEMAHFRDCLEGTATPISDGEQGLEVVRILEAADRSLREEGRFVQL